MPVCRRLAWCEPAASLQQVAGADAELDAIAARLDGLLAATSDIGSELAAYRDRLDADPQRLEQIEARRAVLGGLLRRYGDDVDAVLEWATAAQRRLDELDVSDDAIARLTRERDELGERAAELAARLSRSERSRRAKLAAAVTAELARSGDGIRPGADRGAPARCVQAGAANAHR